MAEDDCWSEATYSAEEIRRKFQLPQIVKISCRERVESDADLDLYQSLLLYKVYKSVKVQARFLYRRRGDRKDVFQANGDMSMVIPKGYTGLFAFLDDNGHSTAKRYMMINDLMKASGKVSSSFLIHHCIVQAFRRISDRHYRRTVVPSGTILRATGIFTDETTFIRRPNHTTLKQSLLQLFAKRRRSWDENSYSSAGRVSRPTPEDFTQRSYLKCVNAFHEEFYIPLTTAGTFYLIGDPDRTRDYNKTCIHTMSTMLSLNKLPCKVKLVCGYLPEIRDHFAGYLELDAPQVSDVILACTIVQPPYQLFEVDFKSEFEFNVAPLENTLYTDSRYRSALAYAKVQGDAWRRQIKIAHQVTVDAKEEEHIYQEIDLDDEPKGRVVMRVDDYSGGSTGSGSSRESSELTDADTMTYRLSVLSHPSRISFM